MREEVIGIQELTEALQGKAIYLDGGSSTEQLSLRVGSFVYRIWASGVITKANVDLEVTRWYIYFKDVDASEWIRLTSYDSFYEAICASLVVQDEHTHVTVTTEENL